MTDRIDFIQALRGIAALAVVFFHGRTILNDIGPGLGNQLFTAGAAGVDLFFIISGFIMVYTTNGAGAREAVEFVVKRVSRVWPVYVVLTLLFVWANNNVEFDLEVPWMDEPGHVMHLLKSFVFYPLAATGAPHYGEAAMGTGWTLNYEMYFYAVFGASLLFGRWRWAALAAWFSVTLVAVPMLTGGFTFSPYADKVYWPAYLNLVTNPIIFDFLIGIGIGLLYRSRFSTSNGDALGVALLLAVSFGFFQWANLFYSGHGLTGYALPLAVIVLVLALMNKRKTIRVPVPLIFLGDISYSLYLIHPLCQSLPTQMLHKYGFHTEAMGWASFFATTVIAITMGYVAHLLLEEKLARTVRSALMRLFSKITKTSDAPTTSSGEVDRTVACG